jgi:predicted esterase
MWLALSEQIPAQGFIAFGPAGPLVDDPEQFQDLLFEAAKLGLRGYVIFGEEDESIPQENIRMLVDLLNATGTPTGLESVPHAGHDYDPVYDESMQRALEFILPGGVSR